MRHSSKMGRGVVVAGRHAVWVESLERRWYLANAIEGAIYNDVNLNGIWNADELPAEGVRVFIDLDNDGRHGEGEPILVTGIDGTYVFGDLPVGVLMHVSILRDDSWILTTGRWGFSLQEDQVASGYDMGVTQFCFIEGTVYADHNANGVYNNGENWGNRPAWTVYLDLNGNGMPDADEPQKQAITRFRFGGLELGTYVLRAVPPEGYEMTGPVGGEYVISFENLSHVWYKNFGAHQAVVGSGTVSGTVYQDVNSTRHRESGEAGLSGWTVFLDTDGDYTLDADEASAVTDANGAFRFENVPAGRVTVMVQRQAGWQWTNMPVTSFDLVDGDAKEILFGQTQRNVIKGVTYLDMDGDGYHDPGEPLSTISGTVYLDLNNNAELDPGDIVARQSGGGFQFDALEDGTYVVRQVPLYGYRVTWGNGRMVTVSGAQQHDASMGHFEVTPSAPTNMTLLLSPVAENRPAGAIIGRFTVVDANVLETHRFTLVPGIGSEDNAMFSIRGNQLVTAGPLDHERGLYAIRVRVTDSDNLTLEGAFTVSVVNVNEAPTGVELSSYVVAEGAGATRVATISGIDADAGDALSYSLLEGMADNHLFELIGEELWARGSFDFEIRNVYEVVIRARDAAGLYIDQQIEIRVEDVAETPLAAEGTDEGDLIVAEMVGSRVVIRVNGVIAAERELAVVSALHLRGGRGNDVIMVGPEILLPTLIEGGDGDDTISGGSGDDVIYGGNGNDVISGNAGDDVLYGNAGADTLSGGMGNDRMYGGLGRDELNGGAGNDLLVGGNGTDVLRGGVGDDTLWGKGKADTLYGGDGNDKLYGGAGADVLYGGAGNDLLDAGVSPWFSDTLDGGEGHDLYAADEDDVLMNVERSLLV